MTATLIAGGLTFTAVKQYTFQRYHSYETTVVAANGTRQPLLLTAYDNFSAWECRALHHMDNVLHDALPIEQYTTYPTAQAAIAAFVRDAQKMCAELREQLANTEAVVAAMGAHHE